MLYFLKKFYVYEPFFLIFKTKQFSDANFIDLIIDLIPMEGSEERKIILKRY